MSVITKVSDVNDLLRLAKADPTASFPAIKSLASSDDWKEREVAATLIVEMSKKKPAQAVREMLTWADDADPNVRRTASEGLRGVARKDPDAVFPVLAKLRADENLYVKKSVANVLRNAGNYYPEMVLELCRNWASEGNPHTNWIVKDGLRKLKQ